MFDVETLFSAQVGILQLDEFLAGSGALGTFG